MNRILSLLIIAFLFVSNYLFGHNICPPDSTEQFISPVKHQIYLAGTFGELRSSHFHTGIDIKSSKGVSGDKLYSIGSGYISRIKVQSGGYGNVLYITHPNGYTSVYAHLKEFTPEVRKYVRAKQYEFESFELDENLNSAEFPINQGDYIGLMGMSGRAYGPHLHFEIRETKTEIPVNPLVYDAIRVKDTRSPIIKNIQLYAKNELGLVIPAEFICSNRSNTLTNIQVGDTILSPNKSVAFGAEVYDLMNGISNKNGVYQIELSVDNKPIFKVSFDEVSFSEFRKLNGYIDYGVRKKEKKFISRFHKLPGLDLNVFKKITNNGFIELNDTIKKIELITKDFASNKTSKVFWIKLDENEKQTQHSQIYHAYLKYNTEHFINTNWLKLWIPKNRLTEDLYFVYSKTEEQINGVEREVYHIHHEETVLLDDIEISLKSELCKTPLKDKLCVVYCDNNGNEQSYGGNAQGDFVSARINTFGAMYVSLDTIAPIIKPIKWKSNWSNLKRISFHITDNLDTKGNAKEIRYKAFIDYQWILFEFDKKNNMITYHFDEYLERGEHQFKLVVEDDRGNHNSFVSTITY